MKASDRSLIVGAAIAFFFTLTLAAFAQEQPAPTPVVPPAEPAAVVEPTAPTPPLAPKSVPKPKPSVVSDVAAGVIAGWSEAGGGGKEPVKPSGSDESKAQAADDAKASSPEKSTLRRIDGPDAAADDTGVKPANAGGDVIKIRRAIRKGHSPDDYVRVADDIHIESDEKIEGDIVGIMGDVLIDGEAMRDAASIMGDITINGTVHGDVSAVMGDVKLGPKAVVDGDVTTLGGEVKRSPGATVGGKISRQDLGKKIHAPEGIQAWWDHALSHGAFMGFGRGLGWLFRLAIVWVALAALLGLAFPGGIRRTGDMLVQRPAAVLLSALLTMLALPILFILLCITVIGIPVAILGLPIGIFVAVLFGQASIYGLLGRAVTRDRLPVPVMVIIGGFIVIVLHHLPIIGLALLALMAALGLGCSITALLTAGKKPTTPTLPVVPFAPAATPAPVAPSPATPVPPVAMAFAASAEPVNPFTVPPATAPVQSPGFGSEAAEAVPPVMPVPPVVNPSPAPAPAYTPPPSAVPLVPNATLPRAGFWVRMAALLIDVILVGMIFGPVGAGELIVPGLAAYGAVMWKLKGTTIGGIVCSLRVVRLDDRPLDWPTTVVRALGCFLSLAVACLGFVWVVFDPERQSWHDKIAGTVVVRAPKGASLV